MAGIFLLLTAAATVVMVFARVSADTDQPTLSASLRAVADSRAMYGLSGAARLLSGVTLMAAAWYWLHVRGRPVTSFVPALFSSSGLVTALSGALAIVLATTLPDASEPGVFVAVDRSAETFSDLRWITGKVGFTLMGLALILAAPYQWKAGGILCYIAIASVAIGISMQFVWIDAATVMHRISGVAVFFWLVAVGVMLTAGSVERQFASNQGNANGG